MHEKPSFNFGSNQVDFGGIISLMSETANKVVHRRRKHRKRQPRFAFVNHFFESSVPRAPPTKPDALIRARVVNPKTARADSFAKYLRPDFQ
jgi:hypothetical protein